jgi:CheY-like chemotaxis protein
VTPERPIEQIPDDRLEIQPGDSILLIVEDDPHYARIMVDLAREKGFRVLVAVRGADALDLAKQYQPTAVSLDVFLPDMLGWTVLSQLKQNPLTRHIPVQIITLDEDRQHGLARGAFSFVTKPTSPAGVEAALTRIKEYAQPRRKRLLVVEDDRAEQMSIAELLGHDDIEIVPAGTGAEAVERSPAGPVRLRRARPAASRHDGIRSPGGAARRLQPLRRAGGCVHRPRIVGGGRRPVAHHGAQHRGKRGRIA